MSHINALSSVPTEPPLKKMDKLIEKRLETVMEEMAYLRSVQKNDANLILLLLNLKVTPMTNKLNEIMNSLM